MLTLEGLESVSVSSLPKLINILLQLLGLVIVIINTACSVIMPFLKTRWGFMFQCTFYVHICKFSRLTSFYSTGRANTSETDAPIDNELNIIRS